MRLGVTRMQLAPHLVRPAVAPGEKMLNSPSHGMLRSLHTKPPGQSQPSAWLCTTLGLVLSLSDKSHLSQSGARYGTLLARVKVTPYDDITQSLQLSSHSAHLNTSTCDCAP